MNKIKLNIRKINFTHLADNKCGIGDFFTLQRYSVFPQLPKLLRIVLVLCVISCNKIVEVNAPSTAVTSDNIYSNDATAASVLTGLYTALSSGSPVRAASINSLSLIAGLSSDELSLYGGPSNANNLLVEYYQNRVMPGVSSGPSFNIWSDFYSKLYIVNLAIERLNVSSNLTPAIKSQLIGEAKFLRGLLYFFLINLYGDVPLTTSSDYRINSTLARSPKNKVYEQIISDLQDSRNLLTESYVAGDAFTSTLERTRPNKWAAMALMARVYLYSGQWQEAESNASAVINAKHLYDTTSLAAVYLKNSKEAIWQLQPVNIGWNTEDAKVFIIPVTGPTSNSTVGGYPVFLSSSLLNSFEPNDKRKFNWIGSTTVTTAGGSITYFYPSKYKNATVNAPITEYSTVLRIGEQYLIRAEAKAQQGKITEANNDLNVIRNRAGLSDTVLQEKTALLSAILHERNVELFTEWGHRWMDLKRSGKVDSVLSSVIPAKGSTWDTRRQLYPIPLYDIAQNPNLVQNPGY